jgi:hypothetical protein
MRHQVFGRASVTAEFQFVALDFLGITVVPDTRHLASK